MICIYNLLHKTVKSGFYKILLVFTLTLISSCQKDVLNKVPLDSFSDAAVFTNADLTTAFIDNTYRIMPKGFIWSPNLRLACVSDEASNGGDANYININQGNMTPDNSGPAGDWASYYGVITKCNIFFEHIGIAPFDETVKNRMIGEMKVLRAYSYHRLISFYGGVPLVTKVFDFKDDFMVSRNTYEECLNFVITELDEAANLLPLDYAAKDKGRITKGAAMAVKSRALLYAASPLNNLGNDQGKWQKAADAALAVINLNKYALYPDYKKLFLNVASYNSEIIWSRPFNNLVDMFDSMLELGIYPNGYGGWGHAQPLHNLVDDYEMANGLLPANDPAYDPQNPYVNRDPRFYATILYDGAPFQERTVETFLPGGRDSNEGPKNPQRATYTGYYARKYADESIITPYSDYVGSTPWTYFRYAEILLNYAEAKYYLGDAASCREYINKVRSRPGVLMPDVTESGDPLLKRLQNERRIELAYEEHRWFDVRRWKIAPQVLNVPGERMSIYKDPATGIKTYTVVDFQPRAFFDKNYLVPIPQSEINKNKLLTQNPGY